MATQTEKTVFERAYNSFSGVDIKAMVGTRPIANLQAVSVSVTREKAPVYTMGSADPRSFSRGKRGIVGTLILITFDRHALLDPMHGINTGLVSLDKEEITMKWQDVYGPSWNVDSQNIGLPVEEAENPSLAAGDDQQWTTAIYSDQMPPFDIQLSAANEYGKKMKMWLGGVEILNEGMGFSIDDINMEMQTTYVARGILPWTPVLN